MFVVYHHQRTMIVPIIPAAKQRQEIEKCGRKYTWIGSGMGTQVRYLHWASKHLFLQIILVVGWFFSFCLSRVVVVVYSEMKAEKEAADRAVSLNVIWIECETRKAKQNCVHCFVNFVSPSMLMHLIDIYRSDKCTQQNMLEQPVSFIDTSNMFKCPFVYASKSDQKLS